MLGWSDSRLGDGLKLKIPGGAHWWHENNKVTTITSGAQSTLRLRPEQQRSACKEFAYVTDCLGASKHVCSVIVYDRTPKRQRSSKFENNEIMKNLSTIEYFSVYTKYCNANTHRHVVYKLTRTSVLMQQNMLYSPAVDVRNSTSENK